jgi:HD superfamily phosphodiesterase
MHLPRQKANDGKTLVAVDFSDIRHKPTPTVRRVDVDALRKRVAELEQLVTKFEAVAAWHRADYERERERAEKLAAEIVRVFAELVAAKEKAARLEGELAELRARPWWLRLSSYRPSNPRYAVMDAH